MSCGNPHATDCSKVLDQMFEYLDGELGEPDLHLVQEHLDECAPCMTRARRRQGRQGADPAQLRRRGGS